MKELNRVAFRVKQWRKYFPAKICFVVYHRAGRWFFFHNVQEIIAKFSFVEITVYEVEPRR